MPCENGKMFEVKFPQGMKRFWSLVGSLEFPQLNIVRFGKRKIHERHSRSKIVASRELMSDLGR